MSVTNPAHEVILGGLALMQNGGAVTYPEGYRLEVAADDATWGNPKSVVTTLLTMMSSGSVLHREGDDNREPSLQVIVSAPLDNGLALAKGEKALRSVTERPAALEWLPPQTGAVRAVFDVVDSHLEHIMDDLDELHLQRVYRITMSALPAARSASLSVIPALPIAAPVVINDGSSVTGWDTSYVGTTVSVFSGAIRATYPAANNVSGLRLATVVDISTTKYIAIDWKSSVAGAVPILDSGIPFAARPPEARRETVTGGWTRSYYRMPDTATSTSNMYFQVTHSFATGTATLDIDQVQKMQALPIVGTARQQLRTLDVGGSATTQGNLDMASTNTNLGLGDTLLYTYPAKLGYCPPCMTWYDTATAPARTTDANTVSGFQVPLASPVWAQIQSTSVPAGEYLLLARLNNQSATADVPIYYQAKSWMSGGFQIGNGFSATTTVNLPNNQWKIVTLGFLNLPETPVGPNGTVQILLQRASGAADVRLDEFWLFHADGRLTAATNLTQPRLSVRAPSLAEPTGSVWTGLASSWVDGNSASHLCTSRNNHDLQPGTNMVYTVTTGVTSIDMNSTHFNRHHTHPDS